MMRHETSIDTARSADRAGITHNESQASCTCGWRSHYGRDGSGHMQVLADLHKLVCSGATLDTAIKPPVQLVRGNDVIGQCSTIREVLATPEYGCGSLRWRGLWIGTRAREILAVVPLACGNREVTS